MSRRDGSLVATTLEPRVVCSISPLLVGDSSFAVGPDAGASSSVQSKVNYYTTTNSNAFQITAFGGQVTGGVRVATADFSGDGTPDVVIGTGPGVVTDVQVVNRATGAILFTTQPFESSFTGGVFVAAGDLNGDGVPDLVITPDQGGGPRVQVYGGQGFAKLNDFFGIADPNFRGGARAAIGNIAGKGYGDLVVAAGFGGGPRIAAFDGQSVSSGVAAPTKLFGDFFAFESTLTNGAYVAVGDVTGDGRADIVAGGGPGGGPRVTVFDGAGLLNGQIKRDFDFFAGATTNRGGIRVAIKNLDNDSLADIVVGSGTGDGSLISTYPGLSLATGTTTAKQSFTAFSGFNGGVFVG